MSDNLETTEITDVNVTEWGSGPRVVLIHGGTPQGGAFAFAPQQPLEENWHLVMPDRPGHGATPRMGREDFERDAALLGGQLEDEAHLVGASYGGIVALYIAAAMPGRVRSLTLMEAPAYFVEPEDPDIVEMSRRGQQIIAEESDPSKVILSFFDMLGLDVPLPDPVPEPLLFLADEVRVMRPPWEADVDLEVLRSSGFPILVLTSGRRAGFEAVAKGLVTHLGARHVVIEGTDHSFQSAGSVVNPILEDWWRSAEPQ